MNHNYLGWFRRLVVVGLLGFASASFAGQQEIDVQILDLIETRFRQSGLDKAKVGLAPDGRVELTGSYNDRDQVQKAFSIAQAVVGVKRVAPTTPQRIEYLAGEDSVCAFKQAIGQPCDAPNQAARMSEKPVIAKKQAPVGYVPQKYALVVGIGNFENERIPTLKYTVKDAQIVYEALIDQGVGQFPLTNVTLLTDKTATKVNIERALDDIQSKVMPGDTVVLYLSSHGSPPTYNDTMNVVTYDTVISPREQIFFTSLTSARLGQFVQAMQSANLLVILDTCYSGKAFEKVPGFLATGSKDLFYLEDLNATEGYSQVSLRKMADAEMDKPSPSNSSPGSARPGVQILMSASDAGQLSWESERLQQSFFTHYLIEGIRKYGDVSKAYQYAKPVVIEQVKLEKKAQQTPQAFHTPDNGNIRF